MWDGEPCRTNYDDTKTKNVKNTVYGFPEPPEQERCVHSLPNTLTTVVSKTIGVCAKHWPPGCKSIKIQGGGDRPANPPSIFGTTNLLYFSQSIISPK